jgi:DNA polymerase-1
MPSANKTGTAYLVDAHSLIFQVFHAIRGMTSPSGLPTNALFGFTRDLMFLRGLHPDYLICAFDLGEPTFRSDLYADYKAHREAIPDDLQLQLPHIHRVLEALAIPALSHPRYEADDILATVARAGAQQSLDVFICTSDKDCRQLIDDHVRLYNLRKHQEFGRAELLVDWGITPEQVVDLQTLVGDSVDNVPGVAGIGIKTAAKLLQEFGTLENILANIDRISGAKRQENLRAAGPIVAVSRPLVRLATDVPIPLDWDAWRLRPIDTDRFLALCQEWGFHGLANQARAARQALVGALSSTQGSGEQPVQGELFSEEELFPFGANAAVAASGPLARSAQPTTEPVVATVGEPTTGSVVASASAATPTSHSWSDNWQATYHLVDSPARFKEFLSKLRKQKRIAFDLETTSLQPLEAQIVGVAVSWQAGEAWYLALRGPEGSAVLDPEATLQRLRPVLEDADVAKVNQNIKYDLLVLRGHGIQPQGVVGDPMVADYLLHAGERSHNLEELARRYLNHQVIPITDLIGKKSRKQPQLRMDQVPTERVATYAGEDADVAWRLVTLLEPQLEKSDGPVLDGYAGPLRKLYGEVEVPLIEVLAELEFNGIRLDVPLLQRLSVEMGEQLQAIENEIYQLAGHPFNIGSLVQLRKVLFEELKLPVQGRTGVTGAASTDQETLEKLAALDHPNNKLPRKILEQRQIAKLKSTYVDALPGMVNPQTCRVHASFNQTVASTGRLSCLPAGTLVNTERGLVGIETVRVGDRVQTVYGPRAVLASEATGTKPVVVLRLSNGLQLQCSPEHRIRSLGRWVAAGEMHVGDPVYMTFHEGLFGQQTALHLGPTAAYKTHKTPALPDRWTVELAEFIGYLMADGHIARSNYNGKPAKIVLAFGWDDQDLIEKFSQSIRSLIGKEATYRRTRTCPVLEVSSVDLAGAVEALGAGGKSRVIRVPRSLFGAPQCILAGFLRGYFEGDGCVGRGAGIQVRSTSR